MKPLLLSSVFALTLYHCSFSQDVKVIKSEQADVQHHVINTGKNEIKKPASSYFSSENSFAFNESQGKMLAENRKQKLLFETSGTGFLIKDVRDEKIQRHAFLSLKRINECSVSNEKYTSLSQRPGWLLYAYRDFDVEYENSANGLRQNFIIRQKNGNTPQLALDLNITGELIPVLKNDKSLSLYDPFTGNTAVHYDDLVVWDAKKNRLPAHMELSGKGDLSVIVDDRNAEYPITIDPLTHGEEWTGSAVGLLPTVLTNLQLQVDALYGYRTFGLGDVNGDTYDDIAISAPGAVDIIAGPSTLVNVGAVFIYFGSPTGLSTVPNRVLRPTTPIANALFGYSVAAGNVTGDGKRDIVIGAPGDSYTATTGGNPTSATVSAGKVYVYDGNDIINNTVAAPSSLFLNGSLYFSTGNLGLGGNVTVNALFGFSVAVTEDMTGDGRGEIVIGAPAYASASLTLVKTGAAFVYTSQNISTNTVQRLDAPDLLNFPGGVANLGGLLFGFSVDGAGDYNKDGLPDIVVGAPGGVNLGLPGFLGGSAYVYYGTVGGVNSAFGTQLSAGGGLLSSVANLFGYTVKGARNSSGARTGNIIVAAPVSNVLSNVIGSLRLKAGSLNIFTAKLIPAATEIPVQQLNSPRGTSLLSILNGQNIDANMLTGVSIANTLDVNCDGNGDIIVGEPASTAVGLIGVNAVGGAAYIFTGKADGTYDASPYWTLENSVSFDFGVNAASLLGTTVAGIGRVGGTVNGIRVAVGAPGGALDFSSGILNLGNTLGTTTSFVAGNNGLGKAYTYNFTCGVLAVKSITFNAVNKNCNAVLNWETNFSDQVTTTEIEQSTDGISFKRISTASISTAARSSAEASQPTGTAYYRLKFIMTDGGFQYSDIKKITTGCTPGETVYASPSLFTGNVKIVYNVPSAKGNALVVVNDIYGRTVMNKQINITAGINENNINGSFLPSGVYYVQVRGENFRSETVKIVKQ